MQLSDHTVNSKLTRNACIKYSCRPSVALFTRVEHTGSTKPNISLCFPENEVQQALRNKDIYICTETDPIARSLSTTGSSFHKANNENEICKNMWDKLHLAQLVLFP